MNTKLRYRQILLRIPNLFIHSQSVCWAQYA